MTTPRLSVRGLEKSYGAVRALRGVDLELRAGEVHALVGENGAGKSTLIAILAGMVRPDAGEIVVDGRAVAAHSPRRARELGIAVLHQTPRLFGELTVAENVSFARTGFVASARGSRARAAAALGRAGSRADPRARAGDLPLAERQLVALARALDEDARALVLDEPTAVLPAAEAEALLARIRRLRGEGVAVLVVSHRLDEVLSIADRVTVLRDGSRTFHGEAAGLRDSDLVRHMLGRELERAVRGTRADRAREAGPDSEPAESEPGEGEPVLVVERLASRALGLCDVTLDVRAGEIVGLAGLVGAGRSELIACLAGLAHIDGGRVLLDGREIRVRSPGEALALGIVHVPEDRRRHGVIGAMSVRENATLPRLAELTRRGWIDARAERDVARALVERLAIRTAGIETPLDELSGGNQQKVALGRWLACEPRVLLLDEPTQGIDVAGRAEIHRLIEAEAEAGAAILMASSDLAECLALCDRVAVMRDRGVGAVRERRIVAVLEGTALSAEAVLAHALGVEARA